MGGLYMIKLLDITEPECYVSYSIRGLIVTERRYCELFLMDQLILDEVIHRIRGYRFKLIKLHKDDL